MTSYLIDTLLLVALSGPKDAPIVVLVVVVMLSRFEKDSTGRYGVMSKSMYH